MWPNPQETADFVTFTEEILNGKLHFLCSESYTNSEIQPEEVCFKRRVYEVLSWCALTLTSPHQHEDGNYLKTYHEKETYICFKLFILWYYTNTVKICHSHLTCKVASKCLNFRERVEVAERNKGWSTPFPCCLVNLVSVRERKSCQKKVNKKF